jgi:hypothetical protein
MAPGILQPLLLPYLQRPLLHEVNGKVLGCRNDVAALRVLDHIKDHLHIVYLISLLLRFHAAVLRGQMRIEVLDTATSPPATRVWTEDPTREVKGLEVSVRFLLARKASFTRRKRASQGLPLEGIQTGECVRQLVNNAFL